MDQVRKNWVWVMGGVSGVIGHFSRECVFLWPADFQEGSLRRCWFNLRWLQVQGPVGPGKARKFGQVNRYFVQIGLWGKTVQVFTYKTKNRNLEGLCLTLS